MPSPIAHLAAGYAVYTLVKFRADRLGPKTGRVGPIPVLLLVALGFSMLPDIDSVAGILGGDFGRYHNNLTHSLFVGLGVALLFGGLMMWPRRFGFWFAVAFASYGLHVVMDSATAGRGVMAFWPLTSER